METLSVPYPSTAPLASASNLRESRPRPAVGIAQQATRSLQPSEPQQQPLSAPGSQESFVSVQSSGSSVAPRLQSSSSNVSQLTDYTDQTSPIDAAVKGGAPIRVVESAQVRTPEGQVQWGDGGGVLVNPMSITSPVTVNGAKRTASGHVKNAPSLPGTPMTATFAGRRTRAESMSSTGSRAGELAASLKTRLGYAMAKVQHGWENKSITEVEQLAAYTASSARHSMSHMDYSHRPVSAGLSNGTARLSMYETHGSAALDGTTSPPSKRHSGTFASLVSPPQHYTSTMTVAPRLQPAADIRPTQASRHYHTETPAALHPQSTTAAMSPPGTPLPKHSHPRRPPTLRTDIQTAEAERDALQALFQLGSPHASQLSRHHAASQASSTQASPLRSEFTATPRKVTFARSESDTSAVSSDSGANGHAEGERVLEGMEAR